MCSLKEVRKGRSKKSYRLIKRRLVMWEQQAGRCVYCNNQMWVAEIHPAGDPKRQATIEHVVPRSKGGATQDRNNQVCSCMDCNSTRGHLPHHVFMKIRQEKNWKQKAKGMLANDRVTLRNNEEHAKKQAAYKRRARARAFFNYQLNLIKPYRTIVYV